MENKNLTVKEVAKQCRVSEATVYNWVKRGELDSIRLSDGKGRILIPQKSLELYLEKNKNRSK